MMAAQRLEPEEIAAAALAHMAADEDLLLRFSALSGIAPGDMREAAGEPHFLVAVLDFYLGHEPDLIVFAEAQRLDPTRIVEARHAMAPGDAGGFE